MTMRRYIIDIEPEDNEIRLYQTLPQAALDAYIIDLGEDAGKRIQAVGELAALMELLPLEKFPPQKRELKH